jgi:hypothetical protein
MEDQLTRIGPPASSGLLEGTSGIMLAQNDLSQAGSEPAGTHFYVLSPDAVPASGEMVAVKTAAALSGSRSLT